MEDDMRDFAVNEATKALETSNSEKVRIDALIIVNIVSCIIHEAII